MSRGAVPADAAVERLKGKRTRPAALAGAEPGEGISVTTAPIALTLETQLGRPGTLSAARLLLLGVDGDAG